MILTINHMEWKEGKTKKGDTKFYKLWAGLWLNVIIIKNRLFVIYGKEIIKNKLKWDVNKKDEILIEVEKLTWKVDDDFVTKYAEQKAELGRREEIKSKKEKPKKQMKCEVKPEPNVFGDNYDIDE